MTRKLGTESRNAAILSLRFVRYRFSIMLCAVFLIGLEGGGESASSPSSSEGEDLRFWFRVFWREGEGEREHDGDGRS